jgi:hypothetical protein
VCEPFELSAFLSAFVIFLVKDPVSDETKKLMQKYIEALLEKVETEKFEKTVTNFGKYLKERRKNGSG